MHTAGNEIIAAGFTYVVEITNKFVYKTNTFYNYAKSFIGALDFELHADPGPRHWMQVHTFKGHELCYTTQDGELSGLGIYVFCKTEDGYKAVLDWFTDLQAV